MKVLSLAFLLTCVTCHLALAQIGRGGGPGGPPPSSTWWEIATPADCSDISTTATSMSAGGQRTPAGSSAYVIQLTQRYGGLIGTLGNGCGNSNADGSWSNTFTVSGIQDQTMYNLTVIEASTGDEHDQHVLHGQAP